MNEIYTFEPSHKEIWINETAGKTILVPYYYVYVERLNIKDTDRVLDYCCGSGAISKRIAKKLSKGQLVYADISERWLHHADRKLIDCKSVTGERIVAFEGKICGGDYDKAVLHFSLHDFSKESRIRVISHIIGNLAPGGILYIREPSNKKHGIELYEIINILEYIGNLKYQYKINKNIIMGEFIDFVVQPFCDSPI